MPRYRFSAFVLSPRRRLLLFEGVERPLIPRYFDLLVFLIDHRHEAVHRRDIFDTVWNDVVVSDSALSQAIRTLRRTLGDDSREPRFIRTVSRHGYRFVCSDVIEEDDGDSWQGETGVEVPKAQADGNPYEPLIDRIAGLGAEEDQREAAELLHALGTGEALRRLGTRPGHAHARALLRDTRWDSPQAGPVPILGEPSALAAATLLARLRLRRAARIAAARWAAASLGAGVAGIVAGAAGGLMLALAPGSSASVALIVVLATIGLCAGAAAGASVGAALSVAEAVAKSQRALALVVAGAVGGGVVGFVIEWLGRWSLAGLVGLHIDVGGGLDGLAIGGAAGLGYALATSRAQGLATPRGGQRVTTALFVAAACGFAALLLALVGRPLVGGTIHAIAQASQGSQAALTPLAALIGEPDFGPVSRAVIGTGEGALFGFGLALGLTRRP
ncbi:MAG TPA: winged helix-turn-helix domain-containing protein [Vicinamibacterales bacterium]